jgi:hypothetical protein
MFPFESFKNVTDVTVGGLGLGLLTETLVSGKGQS